MRDTSSVFQEEFLDKSGLNMFEAIIVANDTPNLKGFSISEKTALYIKGSNSRRNTSLGAKFEKKNWRMMITQKR